jgi:ribosomal protein S27AE
MPTENAVICQKCGAHMNRHADKLMPGALPRESLASDSVVGSVTLQMYGCPGCGANASRLAG